MIMPGHSKGANRSMAWILMTLGLVLMVAGVFAGDYHTILANARMICLSCIGIE